MSSLLTRSVKEEILDSPRIAKFRRKPDILLSLGARAAKGVEDSSLGIRAMLFDDEDDDPGQKYNVYELREKYPGYRWTEPATEKQAENN